MNKTLTFSPQQLDLIFLSLKWLASLPLPSEDVANDWPVLGVGDQFIQAQHVRQARALLMSLTRRQ